MSKGIKIEGKEGLWEETGFSHVVEDRFRTYSITEKANQKYEYLFLRRLPDPKPMPKLFSGYRVILESGQEKIVIGVDLDRLHYWSMSGVDQFIADWSYPREVVEVFNLNNQSIWKRGA